MYKPVYIPATLLAYSFPFGSAQLWVPAPLFSYIDSILATGDWTYLKLQYDCNTEIVKVIALNPPLSLVVLRGREFTEEVSFPVGTTISYVDTVAGLLDSYTPDPLLLTEGGAIDVVGYNVTYPSVNIQVKGAIEIFGTLQIGLKAGAYGCCDADNAPEPVV